MLFDSTLNLSTDPVRSADPDDVLRTEIEQFLFREARLLDTQNFDGWLDLWTENGMYWVPHKPDQSNPRDHISLFWEDTTLREVRVRRITNPRNWSQQPKTRTARVISNVMIGGSDCDGRLIVHSTFSLTEWRNEQRQLAGLTTHKLEKGKGEDWKIYLKRVDLVNAADVFSNLEVFI